MKPRFILFGAFDRHNFGDLLFPRIVGRLLHDPDCTSATGLRPDIEHAGLADRDLRPWGGHLVKPLSALDPDRSASLIHCGGELLTCTAYQAAAMLQTPAQAAHAIALYDADTDAAARWAADVLQTRRAIPYVAGPRDGNAIFNAVGGVEWPLLNPAQHGEVIVALKRARWVSVRDRVTQGHLQAAGVTAPLCPDPAVMVKDCLGDAIQQRRQQGEVANIVRSFPQTYIACQFSAEFGDDATLDRLARGLGKVCAGTGLGVVLFRAGAAPWHDQLEPYARLAQKLPAGTVRIFESLHLLDICALIAASRAYCGSSLHGRIVALAYGLPRISLLAPQRADRRGKVAAYVETWEAAASPGCVSVEEVASALIEALAQPKQEQLELAKRLTGIYRKSQRLWVPMLGTVV